MRYIILIAFILFSNILYAKDYTKKLSTKHFINNMVKKYHFDKKELNRLFSSVKYQKVALSVYVRPKHKKKPHKKPTNTTKKKRKGSWDIYERRLLKESRVRTGIKYMKKHRATLERAYKKYGVPPEYITAIIGVETYYGENRGKFPVFDTLTTLAFEPNRRNKFFRGQLKDFLLMSRSEKIDPKSVKGSIAGAIGLCQFMPSNYDSLAVDFNGDGKKQMNNHIDAIGSIAHYFKRNGWKKGQEVAMRVSFKGKRYRKHKTGYKHKYNRAYLKGIKPIRDFNYHGKVHLIKLRRTDYDELWYGAKNFFVITRYNHSNYYAMAIHQLAQRIKRGIK